MSSDLKRITLRIRKKPYGFDEPCGFFEPIHPAIFASFCKNCSEHFNKHGRRGKNIDDEFEFVDAVWNDTEYRWKPTKGQTARVLSDSEKKALEKELESDKVKAQEKEKEKKKKKKNHKKK